MKIREMPSASSWAIRAVANPPDPMIAAELLKALADAKIAWEKMTDDEKEAMLRKQQESWTRQDMD